MKPIEQCSIGIAGMGLMGGAIAMALRNSCGVEQKNLFACDIDLFSLDQAKEMGLISRYWDENAAGEMLSCCDLVFLCLAPAVILRFLERWERFFKTEVLVTDIAGVKGGIVAAAEKIRADVDFIPGHPMAGAEKGGFLNARRCNFTGKNYILTPLERNKPENITFLKEIIRRMGFAGITETTAIDHDNKIAFTSQLCHVIAAALIDCESDTSIGRFGGGSFEDFTRIAMLNAPMWTELFIGNREALLERMEQFENSFAELKDLILNENAAVLEERLKRVRERRSRLGGK